MEDESRSQPLSRRVPGAARAAPPPLVRPDLPPSLLQRMQAAIDAARAEAAAQDHDHDHDPVTEPLPQLTKSGAVSGGATSPAANGADVQRGRAAKSKRMAKRDRAAMPIDTAELDQSAAPQSAAAERSDADMLPKRGALAEPASEPQPAEPQDRAVPAKPKLLRQPVAEPQPKPGAERKPRARQERTLPPEHAAPTRQPAEAPATSRRAAFVRPPPGLRAQLHTSGRKVSGRRRFGKPHVTAAAVVVIAAGSLAIALSIHRAPPARIPASAGLKRQEATTRSQAAAWVAQQVSRNAIVSCDQQMCSALVEKGFPKGNVQVLGANYPVTSNLVIETAKVRSLFGTSLNSDYAPAVIASFGSGIAQISIRVIASQGSAAYLQALKADLQNRKELGTELLGFSQIMTSQIARTQMAAGQVDPRLLFALLALASAQPIDIVDFGNVATGASADIPLRYADLAETDTATHLRSSAYVASIFAFLKKKLPSEYSPTYARTYSLGGQAVVRIEFTAPSPLGLGPPAP
jgi:hypothetical protein